MCAIIVAAQWQLLDGVIILLWTVGADTDHWTDSDRLVWEWFKCFRLFQIISHELWQDMTSECQRDTSRNKTAKSTSRAHFKIYVDLKTPAMCIQYITLNGLFKDTLIYCEEAALIVHEEAVVWRTVLPGSKWAIKTRWECTRICPRNVRNQEK